MIPGDILDTVSDLFDAYWKGRLETVEAQEAEAIRKVFIRGFKESSALNEKLHSLYCNELRAAARRLLNLSEGALGLQDLRLKKGDAHTIHSLIMKKINSLASELDTRWSHTIERAGMEGIADLAEEVSRLKAETRGRSKLMVRQNMDRIKQSKRPWD